MNDDEEKQHEPEIEALVKIAFEKGISEAIKAAQEKDPHLLDDFHDTLMDRLREELRQRGIIKPDK